MAQDVPKRNILWPENYTTLHPTPPHPTPRNRKIYTWKIALQQISPCVTARIIVRFMEGSNLPGGGNFSGEQFSVYLFVIVTSSIWPKSLLYCRTLQNWRVNRWYSIISKKKEKQLPVTKFRRFMQLLNARKTTQHKQTKVYLLMIALLKCLKL